MPLPGQNALHRELNLRVPADEVPQFGIQAWQWFLQLPRKLQPEASIGAKIDSDWSPHSHSSRAQRRNHVGDTASSPPQSLLSVPPAPYTFFPGWSLDLVWIAGVVSGSPSAIANARPPLQGRAALSPPIPQLMQQPRKRCETLVTIATEILYPRHQNLELDTLPRNPLG